MCVCDCLFAAVTIGKEEEMSASGATQYLSFEFHEKLKAETLFPIKC